MRPVPMAPDPPESSTRRLMRKPSIDILEARKLLLENGDATGAPPVPAIPRQYADVNKPHLTTPPSKKAAPTTRGTDHVLKRLFHRNGQGNGHGQANGKGEKSHQPATLMPAPAPLSYLPFPPSIVHSPHTRPLMSKPEPRDEFSTNSAGDLRRGRADSDLDDLLSPRSLGPIQSSPSPGQSTNNSQSNLEGEIPAPLVLPGKGLRERERTALEAASDGKYVQEWGFFMKCYAEGRFNMSNPPDPPPRKASFDYLVAPAARSESRRVEVTRRLELAFYSGSALKSAVRLVELSRTAFQVEHATLSFFTQDDEIIKASSGVPIQRVPRESSIAAHVLLSGADPMIVLDAQKDWRFRGNPLVNAAPRLRFFVGMPLVTGEGITVGVLAIFDPKPREEFTPQHRRLMFDMTKVAIADIETVAQGHQSYTPDDLKQMLATPESPAATPITEGLSLTPIERAHAITSRLLDSLEAEAEDVRRGWFKAKAKAKAKKQAEKPPHPPRKPPPRFGRGMEQAPIAPLRQVQQPPVVPLRNDLFRGTARQEPVAPLGDDPFGGTTPILTSAEVTRAHQSMPTPPDTPSSDLPCSTSSDEFEPGRISRCLTASSTTLRPNYQRLEAEQTAEEIEELHESILVGPSLATLMSTMPIEFDDAPLRGRISEHVPPAKTVSEAQFILELLARRIDCDLVYALRIEPIRITQSSGGRRWIDPEHFSTQVLASHGLANPSMGFSIRLHLEALNQTTGLIFLNNRGSYPVHENRYRVGLIAPVVRDGPRSRAVSNYGIESNDDGSYTGGVVLAAFQRDPPPSINKGYIFAMLQDSAGLLKNAFSDSLRCGGAAN